MKAIESRRIFKKYLKDTGLKHKRSGWSDQREEVIPLMTHRLRNRASTFPDMPDNGFF